MATLKGWKEEEAPTRDIEKEQLARKGTNRRMCCSGSQENKVYEGGGNDQLCQILLLGQAKMTAARFGNMVGLVHIVKCGFSGAVRQTSD